MTASFKVLNNFFQQLKDVYNSPLLHLSTYFEELKRKVDIAFNEKIFANHNNTIVNENITTQYKNIIEKIEAYQSECLSKFTGSFSGDLKESVEESMREIEQKMANYDLDHAANEDKDDDDDDDDEDTDTDNINSYSDADYQLEYDFGYEYKEPRFSLFK